MGSGGVSSSGVKSRGITIEKEVANEMNEPIGDSGRAWEGDTKPKTEEESLYGEYEYRNGDTIVYQQDASNASKDLINTALEGKANTIREDFVRTRSNPKEPIIMSDVEYNDGIVTVWTPKGKLFYKVELAGTIHTAVTNGKLAYTYLGGKVKYKYDFAGSKL